MEIKYFALIIIVFVVLFYSILEEYFLKKTKFERFSRRSDLEEDEIYLKYFKNSGIDKDIVIDLWNEIARSFGVPKGKLRETDSFDKELSPPKWFMNLDYYEDFDNCIENRLKRYGLEEEVIDLNSNIKTVGDYVRYFGELEMKCRKNINFYRKSYKSDKLNESKYEKLIITVLFVFFAVFIDSKRMLNKISLKIDVFYKYYPYLFWGILNVYIIRDYVRYMKKEELKKKLEYILLFILINGIVYLYHCLVLIG